MSEKPLLENDNNSQNTENKVNVAGAMEAVLDAGAHGAYTTRFNSRQGHGYAAEQANHLYDILHGRDAVILGDNNAKNGPDRLVNGQEIQTKYCRSALESVNAAFDNGVYRYFNANNKPMQLEVPKGQYNKAVEVMEKYIAEGKVPNVTDPKEAKSLIREGNIDYETARDIAKPGRIASLEFDAIHGVVTAIGTCSISALINYARALWNGETQEKAIDIAMYNGLKMGGVAFAAAVLSEQMKRTWLNSALLEPSIQFTHILPGNLQHELIVSMREGALIYGGTTTKTLPKLLRSSFIAATATILVLSADDIMECFKGRISGKQLFKSVATLAGTFLSGLAGTVPGRAIGNLAGKAIGGLLVGPGGSVIGAKVGEKIFEFVGASVVGSAGGSLVNKVLGVFIEDDAVEMVRIINERLVPIAESYVLSEEELILAIEDLKRELEKEKLLQMFASDDKEKFADELLTNVITKIVQCRARIYFPSHKERELGLCRMLILSDDNEALNAYFEKPKVDAVEIGRKLLDKEVTEHAAKKALYVTRQTNLMNYQEEMVLTKSRDDEVIHRKSMEELDKAIKHNQDVIDELLKSIEIQSQNI